NEGGDGQGGGGERAHRFEPALRLYGARFHTPGELAIQTGDRNEDAGGAVGGERAQQIGVAGDQHTLRHDADRIAELRKYLQAATGQLQLAFDRLIAVRVAR